MIASAQIDIQKSLLLPQYQNVSITPRKQDYLIDGERFQRVSTIINIIAKPGLIPWAVNETVKKTQEILLEDETKDILEHLIETDHEAYQDWVAQLTSMAKGASDKKRDEAAARGTRIHAEIQMALQNGSAPHSPYLSLEAQAALQWFYSNGYKLITAEMVLWDPALKVAGTCDVVCEDPAGDIDILDWKTGSSIYTDNAVQIAAYAHKFTLLTGRKVTRGGVVHVLADGCKPYYIKDLPTAIAAYQSALNLLRYVRNEKEVWA